MRIKNQLKIISALSVVALVIFISLFISSFSKFKEARAIHVIAEDIQVKFFESTSLRDQYFLYREDRPKEQWIKVSNEIDVLLQRLASFNIQKVKVKELSFSMSKARDLFYRIIKNTEFLKDPSKNKQVYYELDNRLISQVHIQYNEFRDDLKEIHGDVEKKVEKTYRDLIVTISCVAVALAIIVIFISFHLMKLIAKRLEVLHDGAEVISQGKLDFRVKIEGQDEFADLAASINSMTSKLQANNGQLEIERARSIQSAKLASLGEMSATIAHEINNPISVIQLTNSRLLEKLKKKDLSPELMLQGLEKNLKAVERINKIIRGLSDISRDAVNDDIQVFTVKNMMDQVLALSSQKLAYANIELKVNVSPADLFLESSQTQISQVLINLINNAHDAILDLAEKWITVEFQLIKEATFVQCMVTDSGNGIPADITPKIMRPFFTTKGVGKGTGLGLSISKEIIENLGGRFYIDSECSNTRFVFEVPKMRSS